MKFDDYILRGRVAGKVKTLLSEYASLLNDDNKFQELLKLSGKDIDTATAEEAKLLDLIGRHPKFKDIAIEMVRAQRAIEGMKDENTREAAMLKIKQRESELIEIVLDSEDYFNKETEQRMVDIIYDIVDLFLQNKNQQFQPTLKEAKDIVLNIAKEPENDYDKSDLLRIQSSLSPKKTTTPDTEPLELKDTKGTGEK